MYCNNLYLICQLHIVDTRLIGLGNAVFAAVEGNWLATALTSNRFSSICTYPQQSVSTKRDISTLG
jgi:hypothetical protein